MLKQGTSQVDEPMKQPTVEKPEATPKVQSTTKFSSYVMDELYAKILIDARIRDVYIHELVKKTIRSEAPLEANPLLKFPEPSTYENYDLHYFVSWHDNYRSSTSRSLMFEEWKDEFLEEGIHK